MNPVSDLRTATYAGFWVRFVAHLIDSVALTVVSWGGYYVFVGALVWISKLTGSAVPSISAMIEQLVQGIVYLAASVIYYSLAHYRFGTTLGKRPFRVAVVDAATGGRLSAGQALLRTVGYAISYIPFSIGYIMAGLHPRKQALHDLIAHTVSVYVPEEVTPLQPPVDLPDSRERL